MGHKRATKIHGSDLVSYHGYEDGVAYRGRVQDMGPVLENVKYLNEKVNSAPKAGNKGGWNYGGSIPWAFIQEWLGITSYRMDQFATEKKIRQEFITWMTDRDRRGFIADAGHLKRVHRR